MGSNNPPWWWKIGAALKGGDMLMDTAAKGTGLVDWWQNREEQQRAAEEMAKLQDVNYAPNLSGFRSVSTGKTAAPMDAVLAKYDQNRKLQAAPALGKVDDALAKYGRADGGFSGPEWVQGLAEMESPNAPANNPYYSEGLRAFSRQANSINDLNNNNIAQLAVTDAPSLKNFVDAGKDLATTAKTRYDISADQAKSKLASDTGLATQEFSVWMTTPEGQTADGAKRQAKMNTLLPSGTPMEDRVKLATIARVNPNLIVEKISLGPDSQQSVVIDTNNNGNIVQKLGAPALISSGAPKITIDNKADSALATALGAGTVKELSESKQAALKERTTLVGLKEMDKLLNNGLKTGTGSSVNLAVRSVVSGLTGSKDPKLAQQKLYDMYSAQASLGKVKSVDSAPAQAFIGQIMKQYPGLTTDTAANLYMTKQMIEASRANIADHNRRLNLSGFEGADQLSGITKNVYGVSDPFDEPAPTNVFRQKLGGK